MHKAPNAAREWNGIIRRDARSPHVAALLRRYGASLDGARWVHGTARLPLRSAGVYLHLRKPAADKNADIQIVGIEFTFAGMRGGTPFAGKLPFRLQPGDTIEQLRSKLAPRRLDLQRDGRIGRAHDKAHRLTVKIDARGGLISFGIIARSAMRRRTRR